MSRLWRSCPPVALLLWLSKRLRGRRITKLPAKLKAGKTYWIDLKAKTQCGVCGEWVESLADHYDIAPEKPPKSKRVQPYYDTYTWSQDGTATKNGRTLPEPHDYEPTEFKKPTKRGDLK